MTIGTLAVTAALTLLSTNDTDPNDTSWSSGRTATLDQGATHHSVTSAAANSANSIAGAPDTSWAAPPVLD